jgi:hypothetical protein
MVWMILPLPSSSNLLLPEVQFYAQSLALPPIADSLVANTRCVKRLDILSRPVKRSSATAAARGTSR